MPSASRFFLTWIVVSSLSLTLRPLPAADCNGNGIEDPEEIARGAPDCNQNGVPDACDLEPTVAFSPGPVVETGSAGRTTNLAAADFDGDGVQDLALAIVNQAEENRLVILDNDVVLGIRKKEFALTGPPTSIVAGRFDAGETVDVVVAGLSGLEVHLNRGHANLVRASVVPFSQPVSLPGLAAGDLDQDGDLDLAASSGTATEVFLNDGDGVFAYRSFVGGPARDIEIADVDGGGRLDLILAERDGGGGILINDGEAVFRSGSEPVGNVFLVEAADVDRDQDQDLVSAPGVFVHLNQGDGTFPFRGQFAQATDVLLAATLDPDSDVDIALSRGGQSDTQSDVVILANDGEGIFREVAAAPGVLKPRDLIAFQFDDDLDLDLATVDAGTGKVVILVNEGLPAVASDRNRDGILDDCATPFHRGDPNQDGVLNLSDSIFVLRHLFQSGPAPRCLESADANDDGSIDLTDGIFPLRFLFQGGDTPPSPGPPPGPCDRDPTRSPYLGCEAFICR
jgi:hypothetical protein